MSAVADLYRTLVLDHGKRPRNVGALAAATHAADGDNPLCGDALRVEAVVDDERVATIRFSGESCLLATASASLMSERLVGVARGDVALAVAALEARCAGGAAPAGDPPPALADVLAAFADVHRHPVRVGCALLPWRTLARALGI